MGTEPARLSAAITKNIDRLCDAKDISKHELSERASIAKSTFYRNMKDPEKFTLRETGQIAEALNVGLIDILKDEGPS
jgi:DNA-binding Xre family transcriptional regulator